MWRTKYKLLIALLFMLSMSATPAQDYVDYALLQAAQQGDVQGVAQSLYLGADPDVQDQDGATALMWATMSGSLESVQLLLEADADPLEKGVIWLDAERTAYHGNVIGIAAAYGYLQILRYLIEAAAVPVDDQEWNPLEWDESGWTALQWAASTGQSDVIRYLLRRGADPDVLSFDGQPALHLALAAGFSEAAGLLVEGGADIVQTDASGFTPLHYAAVNGFGDLVEMLIARGADLDARDNPERITPLMLAAAAQSRDASELLLCSGASPDHRNVNGLTAADVASNSGWRLPSATECREDGAVAATDRGTDGGQSPTAAIVGSATRPPRHTGTQPRMVSQRGHTGATAVYQVGFSPDDRFALTGDDNGIVKVWHVETGLELRAFGTLEDESLYDAAFASSGMELVSGTIDGQARVWNIASGDVAETLSGHADIVGAIAVSRDGSTIVTGSADGTAALWRRGTSTPLQVFQWGGSVDEFVGLSADERYVIGAGGVYEDGRSQQSVVVVWSARTGQVLFQRSLRGSGLRDIALSPVESVMAVATFDGTISLISLETGQDIGILRDPGVRAIVFAPDGKSLVSVNGRIATAWSLQTGDATRTYERRDHNPVAVAVSHDGRRIITGGEDRTARLWSLESGREVAQLEGKSTGTGALSFSPDGENLFAAGDRQSVTAWSLRDGKATRVFDGDGPTGTVALSPDGRFAALTNQGYATIVSLDSGQMLRRIEGPMDKDTPISFSHDASLLAAVDHGDINATGGSPQLRTWSVDSGRRSQSERLTPQNGIFESVVWSPDGRYRAIAYTTMEFGGLPPASGSGDMFSLDLSQLDMQVDAKLIVIDQQSGKQTSLEGDDFVESIAFSSDGRYVAAGFLMGVTRVWSLPQGRELLQLDTRPDTVESIAFSPTMPILATGSADVIRLWDLESGREICRLISTGTDSWAVVDPEGRFDTSDLEAVDGLHWVMPDDPYMPLSIETFMRDYYEPRLLPRLLADEDLPEIRELSSLNRVQPMVSIESAKLNDNDTVTLTIRARSVTRDVGGTSHRSGVHDLHVFRDGQIIARFPDGGGHLATPDNSTVVTVPGIPLPNRKAGDTVEFSAYAFNADRVKSRTARETLTLPRQVASARGRAYVVTVGIDAFENPHWNLQFAAADARLTGQVLKRELESLGAYADVISIPLIADGSNSSASKAAIKGVFDLLAGRDVAPYISAAIPEAARIRPAVPNDLIVVSFATHGYANDDGTFFLFPQDIGAQASDPATFIQNMISSDELSDWLFPVDAGPMLLLVDACYSARAVEREGFKPGPMADPGLGQLAFNKGMRILAASQAEDVAREPGELGQGLLTYALIRDGIERGHADNSPQDRNITLTEWIAYGEVRVPVLHDEIVNEPGRNRGVVVPDDATPQAQYQVPALFDFGRSYDDLVISRRD
jgi:WD40 repeat protein